MCDLRIGAAHRAPPFDTAGNTVMMPMRALGAF